MKKITCICTILVLLILWGARVFYINKNAEKLNVEVFATGETVSLGKNFFENGDEELDGYTVKVVDSKIVTAEEFLDSYNVDKSVLYFGDNVDYFYIVKVSVKNESNPYAGKKGINLRYWFLQGDDYMLRIDETAYKFENPSMNGSLGFSLNTGTEKELVLPFMIMSKLYTPYKDIVDNPPKMVISLYPTKNMLSIT